MKKVIVSLVAIATITFSAQAQTRRSNSNSIPDSSRNTEAEYKKSKHQGKSDRKEMAEKLDLSSDQKQQMKSINSDFKNKMNELKSSNLTADELTSRKESLHQERKQKTGALLTAEQKNKLNDLKTERTGKREMGSAKRTDNIKEKLGLSADQAEKLKVQQRAYKAREEAIKSNQALSTGQKNGQLKSLREERKNSLKSILTAGQIKQMKEMKHKRPKTA